MEVAEIQRVGRELDAFLAEFSDCFGRCDTESYLDVYVKGQNSDLQRKSAEPIALRAGIVPRSLQVFPGSANWDEHRMIDRVQEIVARDHSHSHAIGLIDETGMAKKGVHTAGVQRQWNGNRGKVDNCVVSVHLGYTAHRFSLANKTRPPFPSHSNPELQAPDVDRDWFRPQFGSLAESRLVKRTITDKIAKSRSVHYDDAQPIRHPAAIRSDRRHVGKDTACLWRIPCVSSDGTSVNPVWSAGLRQVQKCWPAVSASRFNIGMDQSWSWKSAPERAPSRATSVRSSKMTMGWISTKSRPILSEFSSATCYPTTDSRHASPGAGSASFKPRFSNFPRNVGMIS